MKLNIQFIKDLNHFVGLSKRFKIIVNNFDKELIERRVELQKINVRKQSLLKDKVTVDEKKKEDLFVLFLKLLDLYILKVIEPTVHQIPKNTEFLFQLQNLKNAVNYLTKDNFTKALLKEKINVFGKLLKKKIVFQI